MTSDEYEYQTQWWYEPTGSWMPTGWRDLTLWTDEEYAREVMDKWTNDLVTVRLVRRRAPGPVEVVETVDTPTGG